LKLPNKGARFWLKVALKFAAIAHDAVSLLVDVTAVEVVDVVDVVEVVEAVEEVVEVDLELVWVVLVVDVKVGVMVVVKVVEVKVGAVLCVVTVPDEVEALVTAGLVVEVDVEVGAAVDVDDDELEELGVLVTRELVDEVDWLLEEVGNSTVVFAAGAGDRNVLGLDAKSYPKPATMRAIPATKTPRAALAALLLPNINLANICPYSGIRLLNLPSVFQITS
jgi:hypothetical protein